MTNHYGDWRKSSYSDPNGHCQVARTSGGTIAIQDSKAPGNPLELPPSERSALLNTLRTHY